ncbi:MAG TPA: hypothetical protein VFA60_10120 [Terriglobales bacterium]|nr:hypothetical protein [Terriglobales bacterium]
MARILTLLLVCTTVALGQDPIPLRASTTRDIGIPAFGFTDNAQCDADGNLFFHTGRPRAAVILKLEPNGVFSFYEPAEENDDREFTAFRVSRDGSLRLMVALRRGGYDVYTYGKGSSTPSRLHLNTATGFRARNFVALGNEHILVHGYFDDRAAEQMRGKTDLVEFGPAGNVVRNSLEQIAEDALRDIESRSPEAAAAEGEDGAIYMLQSDHVLVFPPGGAPRRILFAAPEPGFHASDVAAVEGKVVVFFSKPDSKNMLMYRYSVFDRVTGQLTAVFQPTDETGNNAICLSKDGLTFFKVQKGRVKLVTAALR